MKSYRETKISDKGYLLGRFLLLIIGLAIMSFGIAMYLKAGLGANPLTTFTHGFSRTFNISVGRSSQLIMLITMIIIFFIDRKRIGVGTIVNAILTGEFINLFMKINLTNTLIFHRVLILLLGVITFAIGLGMYVAAGLGAGAIDSIMIIIQNKLNMDIKKSRTILDMGLVVLGFLLGGDIGIGTILGILLTGIIMAKTMEVINMKKRFQTIE